MNTPLYSVRDRLNTHAHTRAYVHSCVCMCALCIPQIQNLVKVTSRCEVSHTNIQKIQNYRTYTTQMLLKIHYIQLTILL